MTKEEREDAINVLSSCLLVNGRGNGKTRLYNSIMTAIEALKAEPCEDAVSRAAVDEIKELMTDINGNTVYAVRMSDMRQLPPITPKPRLCKDCKFFEYDHVENVDGIPLIVAHEICNKWGDGCKTKEDGYCFLFEPKIEGESE